MTSSWDFDEIRGINPLLPGQARSQIDHLLAIAATSEEELCSLAQWQDELKEDRVLCIFQLPFDFSAQSEAIILPTQAHAVSIRATITQQSICCDLKGNIFISRPDSSESDQIWQRNISRCVMSIPVWGKRAQYYNAYQARCLTTGVKDEIIVPAHESWVMDRALKTKDYEYNLVRRMLPEVLYAIGVLLKAVRITTLFDCDHDYQFSGMFWMPTSGRVTYTRPPRPIAAEILANAEFGGHVVVPNLDNAIRNRTREITKFERALTSFEGIRRRGDPKAALIGVMAVIESVLKERLSSKASLHKLLKDERLSSLDPKDLAIADALRDTRNAIVHEYLSTEYDTGLGYTPKSDRAILNRDLDKLCLDAIDTARKLFKHVNLNL